MKRSTSVLLTVRLCLVVAVAIFLLGTGGGLQAADEVVRIGNIIPLSGPSASVGQQGRNSR